MTHYLICGTRRIRRGIKDYSYMVHIKLDQITKDKGTPESIIEGCCPDSADAYAEKWAEQNNVPIQHHPSKSGEYLQRNVQMVYGADQVIAFWDGTSYGTAHTIATAVAMGKPVTVIQLR